MIAMRGILWALIALLIPFSNAMAQSQSVTHRSITDTGVHWPGWDQVIQALLLRDYNTRVVVLGSTLLGLAAGVIGTFAYLRKRALMGDALSHATLPGIALVFLIIGAKSMPLLLLGAAVSGVLGVLAVIGLRTIPRIKEDAAIGIVLSVFFGLGMVLFGIVQQMKTGNEAGIQSFIYGKAAAMLHRDAWLIGGIAGAVVVACTLFYKDFRILCFDEQFAGSQGCPVVIMDLAMMALVVLTTVVGLQAVGLILVVALLIIPPAAARFWTDDLSVMTILAGTSGAASAWFGATLSALMPRLPTGAVIVLCAGAMFLISMLAAPRRGLIARFWRSWSLSRRIGLQHILRALAEHEERYAEGVGITIQHLLAARSWSSASVHRSLNLAIRRGEVTRGGDGGLRLTSAGRVEAARILRNHRLWELYLIRHADIAPSHVDRDADDVEHVLSEPIVRELERALDEAVSIPPSPHAEGGTA